MARSTNFEDICKSHHETVRELNEMLALIYGPHAHVRYAPFASDGSMNLKPWRIILLITDARYYESLDLLVNRVLATDRELRMAVALDRPPSLPYLRELLPAWRYRVYKYSQPGRPGARKGPIYAY